MVPGKTLLRRVLKIGGITIAALVVLVLILSIFRVSIPLGFLRGSIAEAASEALGREFRIESSPRLVIGFSPAFYLENCSVGNPPDWSGETGDTFAKLDRFYIKLGLLPLLRDEIQIDDLEISGLHLTMETKEDGTGNWSSQVRVVADAEPEAADAASGHAGFEFRELRRLSVDDVSLSSFGPGGEKKFDLHLDAIEGNAAAGERLSLNLEGTVQGEKLKGRLEGESLGKLLRDKEGWPYEFEGHLAGINFRIEGVHATRNLSQSGDHRFEINSPALSGLESITGPLPDLGAVHLEGNLLFQADGFAMPELSGMIGETSVKGTLDIDLTEEMPEVKGNLDLGRVDLAVLKRPDASDSAGKDTERPPPPGASKEPGKIAGQNSDSVTVAERVEQARRLLPFFGEIRLTVEEVVGRKTSLKDLDFGVQLHQDVLTADVSVNFADAPLEGDLEIRRHDRDEDLVTFDLKLEARDADIGSLVKFYSGAEGFSGDFENLSYTIEGAGPELPEAWEQRRVILKVNNANLTYQGKEKSLDFQLAEGTIDSAWNRESRMGAKGSFLAEAFELTYDVLPHEKATDENPPFLNLAGTGSGLTWRLAGETRRSDEAANLPLDLELSGESLGDLHRWLGIPEAADLPYAIEGRILFRDGWHLESMKGKLGGTVFSGEIGVDKKGEQPANLARIEADQLDFRELGVLFKKEAGETEEAELDRPPGIDLNAPLLPSRIHIDDAEIDLKIGKLILENGEISDLAYTASVDDGWVEDAPFVFSLGDAPFNGKVDLDFRGKQPEVGLDLEAETVDVGELLGLLGLASGIEARAGSLNVSARARGRRLRDILVNSDLDVELSEAVWFIRDANTKAAVPITIETGSITGGPGEETVLKLDGEMGGEHLSLEFHTDGVDALMQKGEEIKIDLDAEVAGSRIELDGRTLLPLNRTNLDSQLSISGSKLSDLDGLLKVDLPPIGPYTLNGRIQIVEDGYSLSDLDFKIGETDLTGSLVLNTKAERPFLELDLNTDRFQLNDFIRKEWSPMSGSKDRKRSVAGRLEALDENVAELLNARVLGSFDAKIALKAGEFRSGKDTLGGGSLAANLKSGRLTVSPATISIPGGSFSAFYHYYPRARDYDMELRVKTDGFDYGILARRNDPESDSRGHLHLDVALKTSRAPMGDFSLGHASGRVDFEVCPEKMDADVFDFWGTNLLLALIPRFDPERNSKVNCLIGRMVMENGIMTPEVLGIDTTRVRVISEGMIDFRKRTIDLTLVPRAKKPEFLRAGTRLSVTGTLDDFGIDAGPLPILRSLTGMAGSTVLFPGNLLFQKRIPEDGSDVCSCAKGR